MVDYPALSGIDDASQVRLALVVNKEIAHVPLNTLLDVLGFQPLDADLTSWALITRAAGFDTFVATPSSANLAALLTDEAGTGVVPFQETGTWTPAITFGGAGTGVTYTTQTGRYTKIGRMVFIEGELLLSNNGSATGAAVITGLPFTVGMSTAANIIGYTSFAVVAGMAGIFTGATTTIELRTPNTTGTTAPTDANVGNTARFFIGGSYSV